MEPTKNEKAAERRRAIVRHIVATGDTLRATANVFGVSPPRITELLATHANRCRRKPLDPADDDIRDWLLAWDTARRQRSQERWAALTAEERQAVYDTVLGDQS